MDRVKPRIIIAFYELSGYASREQLRGILHYERLHNLWNFTLDYHSYNAGFSRERDYHDVVGFIGEERPEIANELIKRNVPCVFFDPSPQYLKSFSDYSRYAVVECDGLETGRIGAKHFLDRNYQNFAFVHAVDKVTDTVYYWSLQRQYGFETEVKKHGFVCNTFVNAINDVNMTLEGLQTWLVNLPKPIGIMVDTDSRALSILQMCHKIGFSVPEQIAILGVDDDELLCKSANTPLSSVNVANFDSGVMAANLLDQLVKNKIRKPRTVQYRPISVVSRRSTDAACFEDPLVNQIFKIVMNANGCNVTVKDIADHLCVSRRCLELRFRAQTGHSLIEEIQNERIHYICSLLKRSDITLSDIVIISGFKSQVYLSQFFKKMKGMTMREYREQIKPAI